MIWQIIKEKSMFLSARRQNKELVLRDGYFFNVCSDLLMKLVFKRGTIGIKKKNETLLWPTTWRPVLLCIGSLADQDKPMIFKLKKKGQTHDSIQLLPVFSFGVSVFISFIKFNLVEGWLLECVENSIHDKY